jgi:uncharacterized protein (TIGR00255 family)
MHTSMIQSMTGFSVVTRELPHGTLNLELRSVNHRFLDVLFRLAEELRAMEPQLRELIGARVSRGKVECRLGFSDPRVESTLASVNTELLSQLAELERKVKRTFPEATSLSVADVLRWPGVLAQEELPLSEIQGACLVLLRTALDELVATRAREGERLKQFLLERVQSMEQCLAEIVPRLPQLVDQYQERLATRLKEAVGNFDDELLGQEIALYATKIDVEEELSRLSTHLAEVQRVLEAGGVVGKRLDFLMQELNREANTLGSKSVDAEVSKAAMELKVLIEQMREQVQNIE